MTWKAFHNRGETLRTVIAVAADRRDGILPMDLPGVSDRFHDELDLLGALQLKWHTLLAGHIESELSVQPWDLRSGVATGWALASAEMPGVRMIIDHYRANPTSDAMAQALARSTAKERYFLAVMAGQGVLGRESGQVVGAEIEQEARQMRAVESVHDAPVDNGPRRPLIERLRAVVAA